MLDQRTMFFLTYPLLHTNRTEIRRAQKCISPKQICTHTSISMPARALILEMARQLIYFHTRLIHKIQLRISDLNLVSNLYFLGKNTSNLNICIEMKLWHFNIYLSLGFSGGLAKPALKLYHWLEVTCHRRNVDENKYPCLIWFNRCL